ncbi:4-hydroxy-3-methylbut-2-en-1-yl diphosphate synthase (ferredoxin), chloroplastic-like isoform X8 [Henckelia pumila]
MLGGGRPNENTMIPCFTEENRVPNDINTLPHLQLFGHGSNSVVMVQAYRLLVAEMNVLEWDYPLHLGVTEAGEGNDGQMKSASGIGTLLMDGLNDTIRVSLTEEEIDPCRRLANLGMEAAKLQKGVAPEVLYTNLAAKTHPWDAI